MKGKITHIGDESDVVDDETVTRTAGKGKARRAHTPHVRRLLGQLAQAKHCYVLVSKLDVRGQVVDCHSVRITKREARELITRHGESYTTQEHAGGLLALDPLPW